MPREFGVSLVDNHERAALAGIQQSPDEAVIRHVAGGIVGRGQENQPDPVIAGDCVQNAFLVERKIIPAARDGDDAGALGLCGDAVHAEGRRAVQDGILAGAAENAGQKIDAFITAARDQQVILLHAIQAGQPGQQFIGLRVGVAVEAYPGAIAGVDQRPGSLVGIEQDALARRLLPRRGIGFHGQDVRPRQRLDAHAEPLRQATAMRCASRPSNLASVSAVGPTCSSASRLAVWKVMRRMKSPIPSAPCARAQP